MYEKAEINIYVETTILSLLDPFRMNMLSGNNSDEIVHIKQEPCIKEETVQLESCLKQEIFDSKSDLKLESDLKQEIDICSSEAATCDTAQSTLPGALGAINHIRSNNSQKLTLKKDRSVVKCVNAISREKTILLPM